MTDGRRASVALGALLVTAAVAPAPASAEIRRIAIVVGSNQGDASHAPLRYAEQDALKLSAVLGELGGLAASDLLLLRAPKLAEVRAALDDAGRRIARWHTDHHGQAVLLFYFSGHSNGQVLELGGEALPFAELRRRLAASGADVRLVIVDSCRSGALFAMKGGTLGQPFDIRLADDLGSTGDAFIASSAADEVALESSEIGASFFSHHFISGLRGAADLSGDGLVTLAEAYQYAFARTLRATSDTLVGPQHPAYDYHLAGRGDLVLTELRHPSAALDLPSEFDRLLLVATAHEQVVAEIGARSAHRIAVASGEYQLRAWRGAQMFAVRLKLAHGEERKIAAAEIMRVAAAGGVLATKGGGEGGQEGGGERGGQGRRERDAPDAVTSAGAPSAAPGPAGPWSLSAALGAVGAASGGLGDAWLAALRVGVDRGWGSFRLAGSLLGGSGRAAGTRESRFAAELLPSWWDAADPSVSLGVGLGVGAGAELQTGDVGGVHWSGLAWFSPTLMLQVPIDRRLALNASVQLPITLLRRDDSVVVSLLPAAWLGLSRSF